MRIAEILAVKITSSKPNKEYNCTVFIVKSKDIFVRETFTSCHQNVPAIVIEKVGILLVQVRVPVDFELTSSCPIKTSALTLPL